MSICCVTSSTHRQLTSSSRCRDALQCGHCGRCSVSHRLMHGWQHSFEQCGQRRASLSFSMQMKQRKTSERDSTVDSSTLER